MQKVFRFHCLAAAFLPCLASGLYADPLEDNGWPQWRGPGRDGRIASSPWPADLSDSHLAMSWSVPQGPSYSGPIVSQDRVFVTETMDARNEVVRALDRATGEQIWEAQWEGAMRVPFFAAANGSWIRATPAYDGERLYVAGMKDVLVRLDAESGDVLWNRDFAASSGSEAPKFGNVSSPLLLVLCYFIVLE